MEKYKKVLFIHQTILSFVIFDNAMHLDLISGLQLQISSIAIFPVLYASIQMIAQRLQAEKHDHDADANYCCVE